jgi:hypothetical protein
MSKDIIRIDLRGARAEIDTQARALCLFTDSSAPCLAFKLAGSLEYHGLQSAEQPLRLEKSDGRHLVFTGSDGVCAKEIHLEIHEGWIDYWLIAKPQAGAAPVKCMHYGQDGPGQAAASAHAFEEFYVLCPDRYGTAIPKTKVNVKLGIHSHRFDKDSEFCHDAGRTIVAPYVVALAAGKSWLGIGTLEIPSSEWGLNLTLQDGKARLDFDYGINLKLDGPYTFPKITFFAGGADRIVTIRKYVDRLYADGLATPQKQWEDFWAGPLYCFFADQMYEYQVDRPTDKMLGEIEMKNRYCTDAFLVKCTDFLKQHEIDYRVIIYDAGWFIMNGTWRPDTARVKDLRSRIRQLQGEGKKVLLWYAPFFACAGSDNYKAHPEMAVRQADGSPAFIKRLEGEVNYLLDFTNPITRESCRRDLACMLSVEGLNADGLKLDCVHQAPDTSQVFHDPAWGTGERLAYNAMRFIYDEAKKVKPECLLNSTAGNPLFNHTFDLHRIHDALEYNIHMYEQRAWAAWVCRAGISDLDDWSSYDIFTVRANLRKIVYGVPSLYAIRRRGCQRRLGCGFGLSYTVSDEELNLISSFYALCLKAPIDLSQELFIDPDDQVFWRKYTSGKLAGFYAATTLAGNQAVAAYDEQAAYVVSIADIPLAVELPPGAGKVKVAAISRTGKSKPVKGAEVVGNRAVFESRRCDGEIKRFEVRYVL